MAVNGVDTTKDTVIVITAEGYDDVTYTIAKTGDGGGSTTDPSKPETPASVAVDNCVFKAKDASVFGENTDYYRLTFKNLKEAELHAYINAVTSVEVDGAAYSEKEYFSFKESQFRKTVINSAYGSMYDALDLAANGVDTSKDVKVVIKATGYADLTYTIKKAGDSSDGKDDNTEEAKYKVSSCELVDGRYRLMFDGFSESELKSFLGNITEVKVGENTYEELSLVWGDSKYHKAESKGQGIDCLELSANGFNASGETEIIIKGTVDGKEVTITYTFTAE